MSNDFKPDFTPKQLKEKGVYAEVYDKSLPSLASLNQWPSHWIHPDDAKGWLQWYERYHGGRKHEDDERQIKRWKAFKARHGGAAFQENPTPRRAFALTHWAIDPLKLVSKDKKEKLEKDMKGYKEKIYEKSSLKKVSAKLPTPPIYTDWTPKPSQKLHLDLVKLLKSHLNHPDIKHIHSWVEKDHMKLKKESALIPTPPKDTVNLLKKLRDTCRLKYPNHYITNDLSKYPSTQHIMNAMSMNKTAFNPGVMAGDLVESLANVLRLKQNPPPANQDNKNQVPVNPPVNPNSLFVTSKTAGEGDLNSLGDIFDKHEIKPSESTSSKKNKKSKNSFDDIHKFKDNLKNKAVEQKAPEHHTLGEEVLKPTYEHMMKTVKEQSAPKLLHDKKPDVFEVLDKKHSLPSGIKKVKPTNTFRSDMMKHIMKHRMPYGLAAIGAGAVGTKMVFDKLNKESAVKSKENKEYPVHPSIPVTGSAVAGLVSGAMGGGLIGSYASLPDYTQYSFNKNKLEGKGFLENIADSLDNIKGNIDDPVMHEIRKGSKPSKVEPFGKGKVTFKELAQRKLFNDNALLKAKMLGRLKRFGLIGAGLGGLSGLASGLANLNPNTKIKNSI